MCTLSWLRRRRGYDLFFNRDESRLRARGLPPKLWRRGALRFLAPVDGEAGGTWLAVNEVGLTIALLNLYGEAVSAQEDRGSEGFVSRGLLVEELAGFTSAGELGRQLAARELARYRPFTLLTLEPEAEPRVVRWDGRELSPLEVDGVPLLSSSGFDAARAEAERRRLWREQVAAGPTAEALLALHRSHRPERGPFSPCMHRPEAATVSLTWVRVTAGSVSMAYAAGPPCEAPLGEPLALPRRAAAVIA